MIGACATATRSGVELTADHPGFSDPAYRARRDLIAAIGAAYESGLPIPDVPYTAEEDEVWRLVSRELAIKHERFACRAYLKGAEALALRLDVVPQLSEVSDDLAAITGFRIEPVPGLVPARRFYGTLADRRFLSSQYIRHHSVPFYTPEPDVIHEVIGHANGLANPTLASLYEAAGGASRRAASDEAHEFFSRVFWFTMEFGWCGRTASCAPTARGCCRPTASSTCSARPRSGRSTSGPWAPRTTTSPSTSRCCTPQTPSRS